MAVRTRNTFRKSLAWILTFCAGAAVMNYRDWHPKFKDQIDGLVSVVAILIVIGLLVKYPRKLTVILSLGLGGIIVARYDNESFPHVTRVGVLSVLVAVAILAQLRLWTIQDNVGIDKFFGKATVRSVASSVPTKVASSAKGWWTRRREASVTRAAANATASTTTTP